MSKEKIKVAIFDFCETLVNFQTADRFVEFVIKRYPCFYSSLFRHIYHICFCLGIVSYIERRYPSLSFSKRFVLYMLKGYSKTLLDKAAKEYYYEVIKPNLITRLITELKEKQNNDFIIYIVSGGYSTYIKYFAEDFGINSTHIISTRIKFEKNRCTGTFDGPDCMNKEKVLLLNKLFGDMSNIFSIAYSDSSSDIPMLEWATEGVVVRKKGDLVKNFNNNRFRQIVWEE